MITFKLENMIRGWFIGNFEPSVFNADFEVGIKEYKSGDKELTHYHKKSKEFTVVIYGKIKMNDIIFSKGDIIQIDENENANFECIDDCITVVVKTRSSFNDKFYI